MKTTRLSSKNQITLPTEIAAAIGACQGTEFVVIQDGDQVTLVKADVVAQRELEERRGWLNMVFEDLRDVWDNPEDDVFNTA